MESPVLIIRTIPGLVVSQWGIPGHFKGNCVISGLCSVLLHNALLSGHTDTAKSTGPMTATTITSLRGTSRISRR